MKAYCVGHSRYETQSLRQRESVNPRVLCLMSAIAGKCQRLGCCWCGIPLNEIQRKGEMRIMRMLTMPLRYLHQQLVHNPQTHNHYKRPGH